MKLTQEEADKLNAETEAELMGDINADEEKKQVVISTALKHLLNVVESEFIEIKFNCAGGIANLKIRANPPQKIKTDLFRICKAAESGESQTDADEDRICEILATLCIEPEIPFELWKSGEVPDEIAAQIIFELMKNDLVKREEMEESIKPFRKDGSGATATRNSRAVKKATK
jgi:hypothetical protein